MRRRYAVALLAAAILALPFAAHADNYPTRPITLIVPFPAGGATDTVARLLADRMKETLGQPIVVENVGGASGTTAVGKAVRADADGSTLSIGTSTTHMLTGGLYKLPFDLLADLDPVVMIGSEPLLIVAKKDFPPNNLKEMIAWLKANPDKASVGIAGVGATGHLTGISFQRETGTKFTFIPFRGNAPARQALIGGQIDFMIEPSSNFTALVKAGALKAIAITSPERVDSFPGVPTVSEAGLPGFQASLWYGLWVRHGTAPDIIKKLNEATSKALADPGVAGKLTALGVHITPKAKQSPETLRAFQKEEAARWWPIIKAANIKM